MNAQYIGIVRSKWFLAVSGVILGIVIVLGIRFATYHVDSIHYHANFAVYLNGTQEEFKGPQYYTEAEMCTLDTAIQPSQRAHMHDNINNVVHVEDHAVTWGHFFTNLGWTISSTFIATPDGTIYKKNEIADIRILLNGQDYTNFGDIQNKVINDNDRLLVSFGDETTATLTKQYDSVPSTAAKYDAASDPASCSSNHETTIQDRFNHMF